MPSPQSSQLESIALTALKSAGINGENSQDLAKAIAAITAQSLSLFANQAVVLPGIPVAADPISGSGSTVGPGMLMPPPAGGPVANTIEGIASGLLNSNKIAGEDSNALAKVIAGAVAQGISMLTNQVKVCPGIPVTGFVTAGPGMMI